MQVLEDHRSSLSFEQYNAMSFILQDRTTCMCFMRHRPIKKVKKSAWILLLGVAGNLAIAYLFYYTLKIMFINPTLYPKLHDVLVWASIGLFLLLLPSFLFSAAMEPGFLLKKFDYIELVSEFIDKEKDLMNLCTYCEVIKSETSFHCLFCNQCTELFDHHCPFINNCLGYRNYRFFLIFIVSYFLFLVVVAAEVVRNQVETYLAPHAHYKITGASLALMILVGLSFPVIGYQLFS